MHACIADEDRRTRREVAPRWHVSEAEFSGVGSYMKGRLSLDKVRLSFEHQRAPVHIVPWSLVELSLAHTHAQTRNLSLALTRTCRSMLRLMR